MPTMFYGDDDDNEQQRFKFEMRGENELIIIGINPSTARADPKGTANPEKDPTIERAIEFSKRNWNYDDKKIKFDGFLMLNVYAQSTSKTDALHTARNFTLHQKNINKIDSYLQALKSAHKKIYVLLAYGDSIKKRRWLKCCLYDIVDMLNMYNATFFKLGTLTGENNPRHIKPQNQNLLPISTPLEEISNADFSLILK